MKNNITAIGRAAKKLKITIAIAAISLLPGSSLYANSGDDTLLLRAESVRDTAASYVSFAASAHNGICYLKWTVKDQQLDGVYLVERSYNGTHFEIIGLVEGIGVPIKQPILYCHQDIEPLQGAFFYRIRHISEINRTLISPVIKVFKSAVAIRAANNK